MPVTVTPFWINVAVITVVPGLTVLADPELLMVATVATDEVQVTWPVRIIVLLSLNVPVAVNCCALPWVTVGLLGVTAIDTRVALDTASVAAGLLTMPANTAVIDVCPGATPVVKPGCPGALPIVANDGWLEAQVTFVVRSWGGTLGFANVPIAVNCNDTSSYVVAADGVMAIDVSGDDVTSTPAELLVTLW